MALTPFPAIPQSSDPPDVFNASVDAFLAHLSTMVFEINTQVGLKSDANTWSAMQLFQGGVTIQPPSGAATLSVNAGAGLYSWFSLAANGSGFLSGDFNLYSGPTESGLMQRANIPIRVGINNVIIGEFNTAGHWAPESGKGISFAGAGGDVLTIYDEGTFTPAVAGASYASRSGSYTRIGNRVFFELNLQMSAQGSSTDTITGLPFTAAAGTVSPVSVGIYTSIGASIVDVRGEVLAGTTSILIRGSNSAATGITLGTLIGSSAIIKVSGSYRV